MRRARRVAPAMIYQVKVTLDGSKPPIWRRFLVPGDTRLDELHVIIQRVMGWDNYHLHEFVVDGTHYGEPDPELLSWVEILDESRVRLDRIVPGEKFRFKYEYDFGDTWRHTLLVEKVLSPEPGRRYPVCIKGVRACPPEDVGGIWGYYSFLEAIHDPDHEEHDSYLDWIGGEFDPDAFDLDMVNRRLEAFGPARRA